MLELQGLKAPAKCAEPCPYDNGIFAISNDRNALMYDLISSRRAFQIQGCERHKQIRLKRIFQKEFSVQNSYAAESSAFRDCENHATTKLLKVGYSRTKKHRTYNPFFNSIANSYLLAL